MVKVIRQGLSEGAPEGALSSGTDRAGVAEAVEVERVRFCNLRAFIFAHTHETRKHAPVHMLTHMLNVFIVFIFDKYSSYIQSF